jgi:hypothetical protein
MCGHFAAHHTNIGPDRHRYQFSSMDSWPLRHLHPNVMWCTRIRRNPHDERQSCTVGRDVGHFKETVAAFGVRFCPACLDSIACAPTPVCWCKVDGSRQTAALLATSATWRNSGRFSLYTPWHFHSIRVGATATVGGGPNTRALPPPSSHLLERRWRLCESGRPPGRRGWPPSKPTQNP